MVSSANSRRLLPEIDLPDRVSQGFQKAKSLLTETAGQAANTITEVTNRAVDAVTATSEKARGSLTETTGQAVSTVNAATNRAVDTVTATSEKASNSLAETIERTSNSLEGTIQKAENAASESVQGAMSSFIDQWIDSIKVWIDSHPIVLWMVQVILWAINHPIPALVIAILLVFVLQRLLKVLSHLVEKALISLLQAPLKLSQFLLRTGSKSLGRLGRSAIKPASDPGSKEKTLDLKALSPESVKNSQKERLANILTRLEVIRQEQDQLLQEVAAIVAVDELDQDLSRPLQSDQHFKALHLFQPSKGVTYDVPNEIK